jgi:glycosyltransferase involved in cell wall biosynthesis
MDLPAAAAFAVPGDIATRTGGYIYDREMLKALRATGRDVEHVILPDSFPNATPNDMADTLARLARIPGSMPLIIDGLAFGALETEGLARLTAPVVALVHHPLALETGLSTTRAKELHQREADNLKIARQIVVTSPHTAQILAENYGVPQHKISVALPGFVRRTTDGDAKASPPLILSVGILARRKGHDVLLEALAQITDLPWQARIVGAARDRAVEAELHERRRALDLERRVQFAGELGDGELAAAFRQASVFALATRYEGYGMVFSEALTYALPIVACMVGAVPGTVPADAGLLVEPDAPDAFAAALRRLLVDEQVRSTMARASSEAAGRLPGWEDAATVMARALVRAASDHNGQV